MMTAGFAQMLLRRGMFARGRQAEPAADEVFATEALAYVDLLYATALRLTRSPSDAEDLVQDTYLKAFRAADSFRPGTNLKAWLFTILQNTFRNLRRDRGRDPVEVDSQAVERLPVGADSPNPEQRLLDSVMDAEVRQALDTLPPAFREAVWLRDVDELSYADIAAALDVPIGTVMSRISRGRRLLMQQLADRRATADGPSRVASASNEA